MPMTDNYNKPVDQPPPCDPKVIPIIPVRYSLTEKQLERAGETGEIAGEPVDNGIFDQRYDLRRIRQGYVYIYAHFGQNGEGSDSKRNDVWLVFRYDTTRDDVNSSAPKSEPGIAHSHNKGEYVFLKFKWEDGTPYGPWKAEGKPYPYAFVQKESSLIDIAWSEERWPADFFSRLEGSSKERKRIMQQVNLKVPSTYHSFPATMLHEKVADFNPANVDEKSNSMRRTSIGYSGQHTISICEDDEKRARVVALHDPVGNAQDLACAQECLRNTDLKNGKEYKYAIDTAKVIRSLSTPYKDPKTDEETKPAISREDGGWFSKNSPIDQKRWKDIDFYAGKDPWKNHEKTANYARAHNNYIKHTEEGSLLAQSNFANDVLESLQEGPGKRQAHEYACSLTVGALRGMDHGQQKEHLAMENGKPKTQWGQIINTLLGTSLGALALHQTSDSFAALFSKTASKATQVQFNLMVRSIGVAQLSVWQGLAQSGGRIKLGSYLTAFGLKMQSAKIDADAVGAFTDDYLNKLMDLPPEKWSVPQEKYCVQADFNTTAIEIDIVVPSGQGAVEQAQQTLDKNRALGEFFAAATMLVNLSKWNSKFGSSYSDVVTSSYFQFIYDGCSVIANVPLKNRIVQKAVTRVVDKQNSLLKQVVGKNGPRVAGQLHNPYAGTGRMLVHVENVARIGNILGIIIATGQFIKANRLGDQASMCSAVAMGASEICFLAATFIEVGAIASVVVFVGFLFVVAGLVYLWFSYDDIEKWAAEGFWGRSDFYFYWGEERQDFSDQLKRSKQLAFENDPEHDDIKKYYNQEMNVIHNLIWGIRISSGNKSDCTFLLTFPGWKKEEDLQQDQISWRNHAYPNKKYAGSEANARAQAYAFLSGASTKVSIPHELKWKGTGQAILTVKKTEIINNPFEYIELIVTHPHQTGKGEFKATRKIADWSEI